MATETHSMSPSITPSPRSRRSPVSVAFANRPAAPNTPTSDEASAKTVLSSTDNAVRMMSETAHDVRAPLASLRESVRLVHDGELGELTPDQKEFLSSAINQCDCIDQMVGEMVQLERLRTGVPRTRRQWINIASIRHGIDETLRPWTTPRNINVVWDINAAHDATVFGDASMVRRLIVNLAVNAIRETPEGGSILIGVNKTSGNESLQWSVVDHGRGMTETEMRQIARRQVSRSGGEGLGLSICRQLAALHFSPLQIESRSGTGTAVSFRTASGGPSAVAERWSAWRVNQREPLRTPVNRNDKQAILSKPISVGNAQVRIDAPSVTIQLECEGVSPKVDDRVAAGTVTLGAAMSAEVAESFDVLLQNRGSMFDMVYRADTRTWVWVFDANVQMAETMIDEISEEAKAKIQDVRLSWTDPLSIPLDGRRTAAKLSEILVRHCLSVRSAADDLDSDDAAMPYSKDVELRLDRELQQLATRMSPRTSVLQSQAARIRPQF